MTHETLRLAWGYLPYYYFATMLILVAWGYKRHRDERDEDNNITKRGQRFRVAFRPFFILVGLSFCFLLPAKVQDVAVLSFVFLCGFGLIVVMPIVLVYLWLREIRREKDEEIEAAMAFDKSPVHGTAGIASPDEQRRAGL